MVGDAASSGPGNIETCGIANSDCRTDSANFAQPEFSALADAIESPSAQFELKVQACPVVKLTEC